MLTASFSFIEIAVVSIDTIDNIHHYLFFLNYLSLHILLILNALA